MKRIACLALVCLLGIVPNTFADEAKDKAIKDEIKALEGKWKVVALEGDGMPIKDTEKPTLTFADGKMGGFGLDMTFTIDPTQKPKHLTLVAKKKDGEVVVNAIYSLDKDELKIIIPLVPKGGGTENKRPEGFDTKGKPAMLMIAKREK